MTATTFDDIMSRLSNREKSLLEMVVIELLSFYKDKSQATFFTVENG